MEFIINLILSCFHNVYTESTKQSSSDSMLSGINHNVDELLVGMLTQIRLREHYENERNGSSSKTKGFKVFDLFEKMWNGKDSKSKSCNNLHVL